MPADLLNQQTPPLPEVSEVELVRHFTQLSQKNYGVDAGFYPLGSCTMKYNPKMNEKLARLGRIRKRASVSGAGYCAGVFAAAV